MLWSKLGFGSLLHAYVRGECQEFVGTCLTLQMLRKNHLIKVGHISNKLNYISHLFTILKTKMETLASINNFCMQIEIQPLTFVYIRGLSNTELTH